MTQSLSMRMRVTTLVPGTLVLLAGCVDPRGRFDDFADRTPAPPDADSTDAAVVTDLPDVDGTFLLAVNPSISPGNAVQYLVTWDLTEPGTAGAAGDLDGSYQPLRTFGLVSNSPERTPVGAPLVVGDVAVDNTASFSARLMGTLPGMANSVTGQTRPYNIVLAGVIRSADLVCGTVTGMVDVVDVAGSTFAAIRVTDTTPANLPAPTLACP